MKMFVLSAVIIGLYFAWMEAGFEAKVKKWEIETDKLLDKESRTSKNVRKYEK